MAVYSKAQLVKAIKAQCNQCNDVHGAWHAGNDCTGVSCPLFCVRPGDGPGHLEAMKTHQKSSAAGIAALKASREAKTARHCVTKKPKKSA